MVIKRRSTMMASELEQHSMTVEQWEDKISNLTPSATSQIDKNKARVQRMVLAVIVLNKLGVMSRVVMAVRKAKARDQTK